MYCQKCGKENPDGTAYCEACGENMSSSGNGTANSQNFNAPQYYAREKSEGLGVVLSFLFVGLGHLYAGLISKGILLLFVFIVLMASSIFLLFIPAIIAFILWIWSLYDVYSKIKFYNAELRRTGNPPW